MTNQPTLGAWISALGQWLLICVAFLCSYDLYGLGDRGGLLFPISGYLTLIFLGVASQFLGAAMPHMLSAWQQEKLD